MDAVKMGATGTISEWFILLMQQIAATSYWQWAAVIFGIAEVLLAQAGKKALYPAGIVSILISMYLLAEAKLYAECMLNAYYFIMSIYGWVHWSGRHHHSTVTVSYCNRFEWGIILGICIVGGAGCYFILKNYTNSDVPFWDAWVSATAWAGMWLLARRKMENWILLNVSNFFAAPLLFYKQLPLFGLLTIFLFVVAVFGYFKWKKAYQQTNHVATIPLISV